MRSARSECVERLGDAGQLAGVAQAVDAPAAALALDGLAERQVGLEDVVGRERRRLVLDRVRARLGDLHHRQRIGEPATFHRMRGSMRMHAPSARPGPDHPAARAAPRWHAARGFAIRRYRRRGHARAARCSGPRRTKSGKYTLEVARNKRFKKGLHSVRGARKKGHDNTVQTRDEAPEARASGTGSASSAGGSKSATGTFTTAPKPKQSEDRRVRVERRPGLQLEPGQTKPYWNNGGVLRRMKAEQNDFNVMLGDTIYSDSEVPGPAQPDRAERQAEVGEVQDQPGRTRTLQALRGSAGFYSHWDDHEFVNDFSPPENSFDNNVNVNGRTLYKRGEQAFRDYAPVHWTQAATASTAPFRWGKNLEVFFLDERSFRSANADANHVCDNPQTGSPDLAPTAPQTTRNAVLRS